jgi:hypothetical protein
MGGFKTLITDWDANFHTKLNMDETSEIME